MFDAIPKAIKQKLWKHQSDALDFAINHLQAVDSPCLIRMPTGTGKTGVIACLTKLSNKGSSLVLTPWAHLRKQMVTEIKNDFWNKLGITPRTLATVSMFPSKAKDILNATDPQVIVSTFATLNALRLNDFEAYEALAAAISLVVVDEGHYEPAVEWGKSVKGLKTKTLLLTATPYRNDLKLFRITDPNRSAHHFTHKQAVSEEIIRELRFEDLASETSIPSLSVAFAKRWNAMKKARTLPSHSPRAIICCSGATDIQEVVTHLRMAGLEAIGIHEQFENSADPHLLKEVPDPQHSHTEIWVHQHKLTEGLDDHRFCCAVLFTRIRNDRKLIQQIGRILRRDPSDRKAPAILLAPREFSAESEWNAYLEFETEHRLLEPQHFRDVVQTLLNAQPKVEYFEGRFRRRFSPENLSERPQVVITPSVLVRGVGQSFSLDDYIEDCIDTLNTEDAVILGPDINAPCQKSESFALWVYASVRNSGFLHDTSLYEIKLETHCVVAADNFVFMADSRGNFPVEYVEEHTTDVSSKQLTRYLDNSFRPTHVSVDSSIPYDTVLRGAELRGHNLLEVPISLTDRVQICRSARGSSKDLGRRYVGISNGRVRKEVSEEDRRNFELCTFISWTESVAKVLNSRVPSSALFHRYMPTCSPPDHPIPKIICLDFLRLDLRLTLPNGHECTPKSSSSDIVSSAKEDRNMYTFSFDFEGDGVTVSVSLRLEYQPTKRRFWFYKENGAPIRVSLEDEDKSSTNSLAEFLNKNQEIILIGLAGGEIVYQGRKFYKVDYAYAERVLLDLIKRPSKARAYKTEKGTKEEIETAKRAKTTTFPRTSLFRAVTDQLIGLPFKDDLLICADMGTECADFVAANFEKRQLALIHAKVGTGQKVSASAFQEVVAQAMKNLVYLTVNCEIPKGVGSWSHDSKWNKTGIPKLYRGPSNLALQKRPLWNELRSKIIGSSNPGLFVVLAISGCCDLDMLRQAASNPTMRTPEFAQLLHLLDGLNAYARTQGVRLIICDLPYQSN